MSTDPLLLANHLLMLDRFLFAINTISMVKNDALFLYIAPANILAWLFIPLRYVMPIRQFVLLNRTVIKLTHWPILFLIFIYEKYYLASSIYEPTDLVEGSGRKRGRAFSIADPASRGGFFSPNIRTREESIAGFQKDRALDEVFRRQPDANTIRTQRRQERRKTQTAIRNWMDQSDEIGETLSRWPTIESRQSQSLRRTSTSRDLPRRFRILSDVRSAASDPADLMSNKDFPSSRPGKIDIRTEQEPKDLTDADGDDELITNDEDEDEIAGESRQDNVSHADQEDDYFTTPMVSRRPSIFPSSTDPPHIKSPGMGGTIRRQGLHNRTLSTNTILFNPQEAGQHGVSPSSISEGPVGPRSRPRTSRLNTTIEQAAPAGTRSPRRSTQYMVEDTTRPRPIPKSTFTRATGINVAPRRHQRKLSPSVNSDNTGLLADSKNELGAVPASFATQMAMATGQIRGLQRTSSVERERENANRMSKLVLARMKTLEESFADVAREVQLMRSVVPTAQNSADEDDDQVSLPGSHGTNVNLSSHSRHSKKMREQKEFRPKSAKEEKVGMRGAAMHQERRLKGKGKEVMRHDDTESEDLPVRRIPRRGSSL